MPSDTGANWGDGQFAARNVRESDRGSTATIWSLKTASVCNAINSSGKRVIEEDGVLQRRVKINCSSSQLEELE